MREFDYINMHGKTFADDMFIQCAWEHCIKMYVDENGKVFDDEGNYIADYEEEEEK